MNTPAFDALQLREVFHLEFLRYLSRKLKPLNYVLKGGVNLRFFFKSIRYSVDMDLDVQGIRVLDLKELVMKILNSPSFQDSLQPYGISRVVPPDLRRAKQTETTQRFKVHLLTLSGEDLFTQIEFSRRGIQGTIKVETVNSNIMRTYKLPPLIIPHYDAVSATFQKINAVSTRAVTQARDIFDLYFLITHLYPEDIKSIRISDSRLKNTVENILNLSFNLYRDTVIPYLSLEDQTIYNSPLVWDEIRLRVVDFIEKIK